MTVLPVIEREMRVQARLGFTYLLRVLGALALMLVCAYFWAFGDLSPRSGPALFGSLNCALLVSIWILVPLLAADCISMERREGTLGLLFLTPLNARDIVLSKGLVHGLRALTLWLSVMPVLTISFLIGGVTWKELALSGLINFSSICLALAAGLLASSLSKSWFRAMLLAGGFAVQFASCFVILAGWRMFEALKSGPWIVTYLGVQADLLISYVTMPVTDAGGMWGRMLGAIPWSNQRAWLISYAEVTALSLVFLLLAILFAAWKVRRVWHEEPPSARRVWLENALCTPVIGVSFFHRWLRRKLERNPIGWLEQRTWSGRLVTWGWFAVMISFYTAVFEVPNTYKLLEELQLYMGWGLLLLMAVTASGSFQRERETRVLELLLVSPMTAGQIIEGRLRALWGQFLPALALIMFVWLYLAEIFRIHAAFELIPFFCAGYVTLPVIGLYYSLRRVNFINAVLSTFFVGLFLPNFLRLSLGLIVQILLWSDEYQGALYTALHNSIASPFFITVIQAVIAVLIGSKLHRDLVHRNFAYSKSNN